MRPTGSRRAGKGDPLKLSFAAVAGKSKLRVKRGRLEPGRYKLKAIATDAAGNRSTPARAKAAVGP